MTTATGGLLALEGEETRRIDAELVSAFRSEEYLWKRDRAGQSGEEEDVNLGKAEGGPQGHPPLHATCFTAAVTGSILSLEALTQVEGDGEQQPATACGSGCHPRGGLVQSIGLEKKMAQSIELEQPNLTRRVWEEEDRRSDNQYDGVLEGW
jgi:hypothetical protein